MQLYGKYCRKAELCPMNRPTDLFITLAEPYMDITLTPGDVVSGPV